MKSGHRRASRPLRPLDRASVRRFVSRLLVGCMLACCAPTGRPLHAEDAATPRASPFDGKSLAGWTTTDGRPVGERWEVVDGVIHLTSRGTSRSNIVTIDEFGDFDLSFEWKISPRGNNGIKYRVRTYDGRWLGCEYQMIDDETVEKRDPKQLTGALYDLYEPGDAKTLRPPGQYNTGRIVVRGDHIEHWLNDRLIVSATVGDAEWERRIGASKFTDKPGFGRNRKGRLMLTDYDGEAWFRNIRFVAH